MTAPRTVTQHVGMRVLAPARMPAQVQVILHYDPADPYAIRLTFPTASGPGVSWVFARELIAHGVRVPSGDGDVRIWPSDQDARAVCIHLESPDGQAQVQASAAELTEFLDRSYELCASGQESHYLNIDAALWMLLAT